jgi:hypothetical protein
MRPSTCSSRKRGRNSVARLEPDRTADFPPEMINQPSARGSTGFGFYAAGTFERLPGPAEALGAAGPHNCGYLGPGRVQGRRSASIDGGAGLAGYPVRFRMKSRHCIIVIIIGPKQGLLIQSRDWLSAGIVASQRRNCEP